MIQYKPYNIIIDGRKDRRVEATSLELPGIQAYEERVRVIMNAIARSPLGQVLLRSICVQIPVYIIPFRQEGCNALTGQISSLLSRGVGVQYTPQDWNMDQCGKYPGYRPLETLFHELVHAERFSHYGFDGIYHTPLDKMKDPEEFLAVMVTNMFRSEQGAHRFNRDYLTGEAITQDALEQFLSSNNGIYLKAFDSFSQDPFVQKLPPVPTTFNPFRDLDRLKAGAPAGSP